MKVLGISCVAVLALSFSCHAATPASVESEFSPKVTEWAEGTVSQAQPDGHFQISGAKSSYASTFAAYNREYFSFPETERELRRKQLQEHYQSMMIYKGNPDKPLTFSFDTVEPEKVSVFDESGLYGYSLPLWKYPQKEMTYKYGDLKAGDRVVVGYDTSERVHSIYRINPMPLTGDNFVKTPLSDEIDKNGVHVMNKSSNETNPVPVKPNNKTASGSSTGTSSSYNSNDYPIVVGQSNNPHLSTEQNPTSVPNVLNDARTSPANSLSSSAPRPVDSGSNSNPPQANPGTPPINSSDGTALNSRAQEQQTNPNQFNNTPPPSMQGRPADNAPSNNNNTQNNTGNSPAPSNGQANNGLPNNPGTGTQPNNTNPRIVPGRGTSR